MGGQIEVGGPDLEKEGVALSQLPSGTLLQGQAQGEAVLIGRDGDRVFAMGAACSHYGAPLVDGVIIDGEVRCPWHHACFDSKTGDARGGPALNPIDCWKVEARGERAFVVGKVGRPARPAGAANAPASVIIVGGGAAGGAAAERLRALGYQGPITMLSADAAGPVDRPNLSKDYLAGTAPEEWIALRGEDFYAAEKIDLRLSTRVVAVDTAAKTVTTDGGATLSYGALVLATGACAIRLSIPGADLPHVFTLRSLADSRAIIAHATRDGEGGAAAQRGTAAKCVVVIGASFIGLEVAAALRTRGLEVAVVAPEARPLEKVLGAEFGDFLRGVHEGHGVVFHLGDAPTAISASEVTLRSGAALPADLVVMGVGVRPESALAQATGLAVDNGIIVDAHFQTSVPGVYAIGDVARYPEPHTGRRIRVEHWVAAQRQGQALARNLAQGPAAMADVPFFWSSHYDVTIAYSGHAERWEKVALRGSLAGHDAIAAYYENGEIRAVASIFRDKANLLAEDAFARNDQAALRAIVGI